MKTEVVIQNNKNINRVQNLKILYQEVSWLFFVLFKYIQINLNIKPPIAGRQRYQFSYHVKYSKSNEEFLIFISNYFLILLEIRATPECWERCLFQHCIPASSIMHETSISTHNIHSVNIWIIFSLDRPSQQKPYKPACKIN